MSSSWPKLEDLIRELGDVCALPDSEGEPSLSAATMAVTKATTALTQAAQARGRSAEGALARALQAVDEARAALQSARAAIAASSARRRPRHRSPPVDAATVVGEAEATCPGCGLAFLVRYRASTVAPMVAFPIACPRGECDGVSEVAYPASATEVTVEPST